VVVAAVDEAAIAKFGRFPWDRRVIAALIDKLDAAGVKAIGFDISFSDEDLGGQFAGAKRYRKRFEDVSLAAPKNRAAVERFRRGEADIAGAASALQLLNRKVKPEAEPIYRDRPRPARRRRAEAGLLPRDLRRAGQAAPGLRSRARSGSGRQDPDTVMSEAVGRAAGKVVLGVVMLTAPELGEMKPAEIEEEVQRVAPMQIHPPEWRERPDAPMATPVKLTWAKQYAGLRAPLAPIVRGARWIGFFNKPARFRRRDSAAPR